MPIRLIPNLNNHDGDTEAQMVAMAAIIIGNLMGLAVLQGKLAMERNPILNANPPSIMNTLPKLSLGIFLATSVYFLALSWRDVREKSSRELLLVLYANLLATAAVMLKTQVVFKSRPGSTASVGAVEP